MGHFDFKLQQRDICVKRSRYAGNKPFYAAVGRRIAKARTGRLTQEALAQKATLTRTAIVNIEKGRQQILLHTVVEIAQALAISITDLLPDRALPESRGLIRSKGEPVAKIRRPAAVSKLNS
jgi:DNA-binding XRE family transcriptional regulator